MNLPGELVRRAAANVSSTVSSVASVASGRKRHDSHGRGSIIDDASFTNAKEKYNMTLKCTPNKDAITTSNLAVKSGFLMKRNEQGHYQKRFLCIVPHTFLYYFDNETSESPRGVIDLELYHNIYRDENNALKLCVGEEEHLRSFYFDDEDNENLNEWTSSLLRDRYNLAIEERNAYYEMQTSLTGVIDNASNLQKESQKEREQLELQLHEAIQQNEQAEKVLQNILVELGITDDEMAHLSGLHKIGNSLQEKIVEFRQIYERKLEEINEQYILQHAVHERTVQEIYAKLDAEAEARKDVEILLQSTKETLEGRHKDYETQIDTISCNFQMAITGKLDAENKVATLTEQKKVLIREVKSVRKKCEEQQQIIKEMKALNENLIKATRSVQHEQDIQRFQILQLQQQLDVANKAIQTAREAAVPSVSTGVIPEASLATVSQNTDHFEVLQEGTDKTVTTVISNIGEESSVTEEESHDGHLISTIVEPNSPPPDNANNNDVDLADTIKDAVLEREQIDDLVKSGSTFLASIPASWNEIDMISNSPSKEHTQQASGDGDGSSILPIENMRASTPVNISRKASNGELSTEISSTLPRRSTTSSADAESEDGKWDAPQSALKDLTWLSDEQSKLVQKRLEENGMNLQSDDSVTESATNTNANNNNIAGAASGASATFVAATQSATSAASSLLSGVSKVVLGSNSTSASNTNTTQSSSVTSDKKSYFSSMFSKTNEDEPHHQSSAVVQPLTITPATVLAGSSGESSHGITNNNSGNGGNNTGIMHCLRCHGTVQGPKLSTCKCSMPALAPEDLQSGSAMFSGFISKGSSVAGGLFKGVGGLMSGNTAAISSVHNSSGNSSGNVSQ